MKISKLFHSRIRLLLLGALFIVISSIITVLTIYHGELKLSQRFFTDEAINDVKFIHSLLDKESFDDKFVLGDINSKNKQEFLIWLNNTLKNSSTISSVYIREISPEYLKKNQTKNLAFFSANKIFKKEGVMLNEKDELIKTVNRAIKSNSAQASEIYSDSFGTWISAVIPINTKEGNLILGLDKDASRLKKGENYYSISITVLSLVFLFTSLYFITSIKMFESNKYLNQRIKESNDALEAQLQYVMENEKMVALGNLVAGVAHEINTPLGVAITSVTYLDATNHKYQEKLDKGTMSKTDLLDMMNRISESTQIIVKNLNNAANLIQSFKRIAVDQSSNSVTTFNLKDLLESVTISLKHEYKLLNVKIFINSPPNILLYTDPGAIVQIITNFIMNSIKHGRIPDRELVIEITSIENEGKIHLEYSDNGKGIEESNLPHIFEPFFTTSRHAGGSGLGLNIVYNLVTQTLKGTIHATSILGKETRFFIDFPKEISLEKELIKDLDKECF